MSTGATPARRQPQPQPPSRTIKALLEQSHERLAAVLPKYLTPERVVQVVSTLVYRTPRLQECAPDTVLAAVLQACELGLDLSKEMGEAYLIPRRNKRAGVVECQFQPGYKGLVKLARQSGEIASIRAEVVREGEPFLYRYDPDLTLLHEPCVGSDAPIVLVYAVAKLSSGERQAVALSVAEIEAIRRRSTSADDGPWITDWAEMAKKSCVRRLCKLLPRSLELATAIAADEAEYEDDTGAYVRRPDQTKSQALAQRLRGELPRPEPEFRSDEGVREPLRSESDEPTGEDYGSEREPGEDGP